MRDKSSRERQSPTTPRKLRLLLEELKRVREDIVVARRDVDREWGGETALDEWLDRKYGVEIYDPDDDFAPVYASAEGELMDLLERQDQLVAEIERFTEPPALIQAFYAKPDFSRSAVQLVPDFATVNLELLRYLDAHPDALSVLHWRQFEEVLTAIFKNLGFHTELGPGRADGGVDLRLIQKSTVGDFVVLVQAKRYRNDRKIGLEAVQALYAAVDVLGAHRGVIATTAQFLPGARQFAARVAHRLILAERAEIAAWLRQSLRGGGEQP